MPHKHKCFVPNCPNSTTKNKDKVFVHVNEFLKRKWCNELNIADRSHRRLYCCEDHLNLEEDLENYYKWKFMKARPKLKTSTILQYSCENLRNNIVTPIEDSKLSEPMSENKTEHLETQVCSGCLSCEGVPLRGLLESEFAKLNGLISKQQQYFSLCMLCRATLLKCLAFKERCLRANTMLTHLRKNFELNTSVIKAIDKGKLRLTPHWTTKIIPESEIINIVHVDPLDTEPIKLEYDSDSYSSTATTSLYSYKLSGENFNETHQVKVKNDTDFTNPQNNGLPFKIIETFTLNQEFKPILLKPIVKDKPSIELKASSSRNKNKKSELTLGALKSKIDKLKLMQTMPTASKRKSKGINEKKLLIKKTTKAKSELVKVKKINAVKKTSSSKNQKYAAELGRVALLLEENFTTVEYDATEQLAEFEKRKESKQYLQRPYKCDICYRGFGGKELFENHTLLHEKKTKFSCSLCKLYFPSGRRKSAHLAEHATMFMCKHCEFTSNIRCSAKTHMMSHVGSTFKCPYCERAYTHYTTYANHVRIRHPSDHVCAFCGYAFVGNLGLFRHVSRMHKDLEIPEDGPQCADCDTKFLNQEALLKHRSIAHEQTPAAGVTKTRIYINNGSVERHKRRPAPKTETKNVVCDACGEVMPRVRYYWHWKQAHPDAPWPTATAVLCDLCGKSFRSKWKLKVHMGDHDKTSTYKCELCPKTYTNKYRLAQHKHQHNWYQKHKASGYECAQCGATFSSYANRFRHMKTVHVTSRDFICEFCSKGFKSKDEVKMHTEHVHLKKPWPRRVRDRRRPPPDTFPDPTEQEENILTLDDYEPL